MPQINGRSGAPAAPVAYVNARIVDPASRLDIKGALVTEGGVIRDFGPALFKDAPPLNFDVVDCGGHVLAPGLVDMRVQLREPGEEHKETIATAADAASAGGVTAMVCLPNTEPVIDDVAGVEFIARRAREVRGTKVFCYAAATQGLEGRELAEMGLLAEMGAVGFTDGTKALGDAQVMRRVLSYSRSFDALVLQHPEEPALAKGGAMNEGETSMRLGLPGIPAMAEVLMIERDLRLVEMTGARLHLMHVSTADGIEAIRRAKARGLRITCDTAPHYFTLTENDIGDYRTFCKVSPPLRTVRDRDAVVAGLADGTIDAIASDHAPQDQDTKRVPFAQAEFGVVGLETLLPLSLSLYHQGRLSLLDVLAKLTAAPASILRLPLGRIAKGSPADLVLFDPDRPWTIDAKRFRSKSKNSPFDEMPVQGKVVRTVIAGRTLHEQTAA
ncbi:MAG: dihydroorotase [Rhodospirillaceae bacterium]|nr:dihydroorotase [Rhodospirillaceae bacterium]